MSVLFYKQGMTRRRWLICLFVGSVSLFISLLFFWGGIDPDFFSFLTVGQGVLDGKDMYRDFDDNKGPVLYLFFALLSFLFRDHYGLMLVISTTLLDASAIILLYIIAKRLWDIPTYSTCVTFGVLFGATVWYKSFLMGPSGGGVYSESLAFPLVLLSIVFITQKKYIASGFLFALSTLTRLTTVFFIIYLISLLWGHTKKNRYICFGLGVVLPVLITCGWFFSQGTFWDLWDNMILWNLQYGKTVAWWKILNMLLLMRAMPVIFLSILIIAIGGILFVIHSKKIDLRNGLALYTASLSSILFAGIFYIHHFIQLTLAFFFSLRQKPTSPLIKSIYTLSIVGIIFFLPLYYFTYASYGGPSALLSLRHTHPTIREIKDKPYLHVITYYPSYYFFYHKHSPDSFFLPAFLEKALNPAAEKNIKKHTALNTGLVRDTAFVAITRNPNDEETASDYLTSFQKPFNLIERAHYLDDGAKITVYTSGLLQ